jgi:hypothetical protein
MRVLLKRGGSRTLDGEDGFRAHGSGFVEKGVTGFVERGFAGLVETEREREREREFRGLLSRSRQRDLVQKDSSGDHVTTAISKFNVVRCRLFLHVICLTLIWV